MQPSYHQNLMQGMNNLKLWGNQVGPFSFMGDQELILGNRIVRRKNPNDWWCAVCYHKADNVVLVAKEVQGKLDPEVGWYEKWQGYRVIPGKSCYSGEFLYFYRHTDSNQAEEWQKDGKGNEIYYLGQYKYDYKDGEGVCLVNETKLERGEWQKGYRQWDFTIYALKNGEFFESKKTWFYNNCDTNSRVPPEDMRAPRIDSFPVSRSCAGGIAVTPQINKSLGENEWATSSSIDIFVNHLEKSYRDSGRMKRGIRFFRVEDFQKMVSSVMMEEAAYKNVPINYSSIARYGQPFKDLTSIFHRYPLILMPYNIGASHFQLMYIKTDCHYRAGKLQSVQFYLGHNDPLYDQKLYIFDYLKQYILKEVQNNVHPAQRHIYMKGLKNSIENRKEYLLTRNNSLRMTMQDNNYDCGLYVCLYMLMHTAEFGLGLKANWQFNRSYPSKLRKFLQKDLLYGVGNFLQHLLSSAVTDKKWDRQ